MTPDPGRPRPDSGPPDGTRADVDFEATPAVWDGQPPVPDIDEPTAAGRRGGPLNRGRLLTLGIVAAAVAAAVVMLRSGVDAPTEPAVGPDGERIRAYHDAGTVDPPRRPDGRPNPPGELHTDARRGGVLLSWPAAPFGFEVRWGRAGGPLDNVRYVASPDTSLDGLARGGYRAEVRAVDEVGQRSDPVAADFEVGAGPPAWQRGLGFVEDFGAGAELDSDRWWLSDLSDRCLRRESANGVVLLDGSRCPTQLEPSSRLVLSEPDADGVRGRVVVLADTPPPLPRRLLDPSMDDDDLRLSNDLYIAVGPAPHVGLGDVGLRVNSDGAFLTAGSGSLMGSRNDVRLDVPAGGPGALHRWELLFTASDVVVRRDGVDVGSAPLRPSWREAAVTVAGLTYGEAAGTTGIRVGLVGLTGAAPDGRPAEVLRLDDGLNRLPTAEQRSRVDPTPTAAATRLSGLVVSPDAGPGGDPAPAPDVLAELGGQPLQLRRVARNAAGFPDTAYWFEADVPVGLVRAGGELVLRSVDRSAMDVYELRLELTHGPGTEVRREPIRVVDRAPPALPRPEVRVTQDGQEVTSGRRARPADLDVEIEVGSLAAQAAAGELVGWVAVRVELDGVRVLDHPTSAGGPAVAGSYRFTLDGAALTDASKTMQIKLVPDRPGVVGTTVQFTVRVGG